MKHTTRILVCCLVVIILVLVIFTTCTKKIPVAPESTEEGMEQLIVDPSFNWSTTKDIDIQIYAKDNSGDPLPNVRFDVWDGNPENGGIKIISGSSNDQGVLSISATVPTLLDSVWLISNYIGLVDKLLLPIVGGYVSFDYDDELPLLKIGSSTSNPLYKNNYSQNDNYKFLGEWDKKGVPDYREHPRDKIKKDFLEDINTSLPENKTILDSHPEYLANGNETDLRLRENCDVWVTFVHEGSGWSNGLGFYTYDFDSPPTSVSDINSVTIIFPDVSLKHSGGGLKSGDKVHLGSFSGNTGIGWVLIVNGWNGNTVGNGEYKLYSKPNFNPESDPDLRQHNVLLNDQERGVILLGFEDVQRDGDCDQDFNDAVFYVTTNPVSAVETTNLSSLDNKKAEDDTDQDEVPNVRDEYPDDPNKAYNNYFPGKDQNGALGFEDLWPGKGDYDFNDLVVGYNFNQVTNGKNQVVEMDCKFTIRAIGGSYKNGFGFQMDVTPEKIASVDGIKITGGDIQLAGNQLEGGQSKAVVIVFSNAYDLMTRPGGYFVNTELEAPYVEPKIVQVNIKFAAPVAISELGKPPFNPFIYIDQNRKKEVHLPDFPCTDLADISFFGTAQDDSKPGSGRYYKTKKNLPWALNMVSDWDHPLERKPLVEAYKHFGRWAESRGVDYMDWYKAIAGYRQLDLIYKK